MALPARELRCAIAYWRQAADASGAEERPAGSTRDATCTSRPRSRARCGSTGASIPSPVRRRASPRGRHGGPGHAAGSCGEALGVHRHRSDHAGDRPAPGVRCGRLRGADPRQLRAVGRGAEDPGRARGDAQSPGAPRRRLSVPRLREAPGLERRAPRPPLGRRRHHRAFEPRGCSAVPTTARCKGTSVCRCAMAGRCSRGVTGAGWARTGRRRSAPAAALSRRGTRRSRNR